MALRGSLLEFKLTEIFQLIANDGKTGQLVIYNKESEAFVIFSRGAIVSAGGSFLNLQTILFKFLIDCKHYSEEELNELLYLCQGEMRLFTQELVQKGYLNKNELSSLSRMSIEDLACSLFFWENGHYRFDSLDSIDDYTAGGVTLSADAVTMEAMRRLDEWERIKEVISEDLVFVRTALVSTLQQSATTANLITDPSGFILSQIDGDASVALLCKRIFFTEYRIYETLYELWKSKKIMPFSAESLTQKLSLSGKISKPTPVFKPLAITFIVVHCFALFLLGSGYAVNNVIFSEKNQARLGAKHALSASYAGGKIRIAALHFHGVTGAPPSGIHQLRDYGFIMAHDVVFYPLRVQNLEDQTQDSIEKK
jgi:hypothetical protein